MTGPSLNQVNQARPKSIYNSMSSRVINWLEENSIAHSVDVPLSRFTWFRSGGKARAIITPEGVGDLTKVVRFLNETDESFRLVGETSNMLFLDEIDYGFIVSTLRIREVRFDRNHEEIHADCGARLPELSRQALLESADGFAGLEGIPGTVGGAVFMNAGAYGDSIHLVLKSVEVITAKGEMQTMEAGELGFSYRNSVFRDGRCPHFIVRAIFHLRPGDQGKIGHKMELVHSKRHKYNEYSYPNLGSVFSGSVYRALAKRDKYYWLISSLFYLVNYRFKIFRRESPLNRKWLNDFTLKRFHLHFEKQPFSDKTMNTIINNGQGTKVYLDYLKTIKELIDGEVPIENEIVEPF